MAKKKRKRRKAPPGVDADQRRRERLEARRQARAEAVARARQAERRRRIVRTAALAALFAVAAWFLFFRGGDPTAIAGHTVDLSPSDAGLQQHTNNPVPYEETPPVSGNHAPTPPPCGTYAEQIPDEQMVHMLEHGAVGILYRPNLNPKDITILEAVVGDYPSQVFSEPYPEMEDPITIVSWGEKMPLDGLDAEAVHAYIRTFRDRGPEPQGDCPIEADDSFEPATPSPSPGASPSPTPRKKNDGKDGKPGGSGGK
jgi:hypothetical protein